MIKKEYIDAVSPYNFWGASVETGISRDSYVERVHKSLSIPKVVVSVTGIRRAGKTYICRQAMKRAIDGGMKKEQTLYVNLEEPALEPFLSVAFLNDIYDTYRHLYNPADDALVVLDEVQNVPGWERWARAMMEKNERARLIITGSSSKVMHSDLATVLTGRYVEVRVTPFSFREFVQHSETGGKLPHGGIRHLYHEYLEYGGFPASIMTPDKAAKQIYLSELFDAIVTKDIAAKYGMRRLHEFRSAVVLMLQSVSAYISVPRLRNSLAGFGLKASPRTLNLYLGLLSDSLLFHYVPIFSYKAKDQMQYPRKLYCADTGLVNAVSRHSPPGYGALAENAVAMELLRRYGKDSFFYWKDPDGREVDFVLVFDGKPRELYQVCWNMKDEKTRERETRSLEIAKKELNVRKATILTEEPVDCGKLAEVVRLEDWMAGKEAV